MYHSTQTTDHKVRPRAHARIAQSWQSSHLSFSDQGGPPPPPFAKSLLRAKLYSRVRPYLILPHGQLWPIIMRRGKKGPEFSSRKALFAPFALAKWQQSRPHHSFVATVQDANILSAFSAREKCLCARNSRSALGWRTCR